MIIYLPLSLDSYGEVFSAVKGEPRTAGSHTACRWGESSIVTPLGELQEAITPDNFINLKTELAEDELLIIDRFRGREPVVQIVDHRNLSGANPLAGRTPIGNRPRFPDISKLYDRRNLGLEQVAVDCIGLERFSAGTGRNGVAESVAHISLCAFYAGWHVLALGWCQELDGDGTLLSRILKGFS